MSVTAPDLVAALARGAHITSGKRNVVDVSKSGRYWRATLANGERVHVADLSDVRVSRRLVTVAA